MIILGHDMGNINGSACVVENWMIYESVVQFEPRANLKKLQSKIKNFSLASINYNVLI